MVVIHDSHSGVCNRVNAGAEVVFQKFEITAVNINENRWWRQQYFSPCSTKWQRVNLPLQNKSF